MIYNANELQNLLKDNRYQGVGALPSQFHAYDWDTIYARPMEPADFMLVSKAAAMGDMSHMIRAIDLCISQDAANLTIGDFYYMMMWLRIHSMPKTPLVVNWECQSKVLRHKETLALVHNGPEFKMPDDIENYEAIDCERHNTESLHMVNVEITSLDEEPEKVVIPGGFDFPRAKHIESIKDALKDPARSLLVPYVQWFAGDTLVDKFNRFLNPDENGMDMLAMGQALNEKYEHGLREVTTLTCANCRERVPYVLDVNPMSFFP